MGDVLKVKDLKISFKTADGVVQAVRGISFNLKKGETLALVGESGSGKSVTCRAILGILAGNAKVEQGEILFEGSNLLRLSERELCALRGKRIGMIFQDPTSALNPIMKIGKQLTEGMILSGMSKKDAKMRAVKLLKEVGIPEPEKRYNQYPFEISGGMRQRVVIAIALAADPDILICDEPTTALDVTIQAQILELITKIKEIRHLSVIFITHDLGVVARVADRVAVMYAGKIVEIGKVEEIFYTPAHPYTWALLASVPNLEKKGELVGIAGTPPDMLHPPKGDAFAERNKYALKIDFEREPPLFKISETHFAATWLLHPDAPKILPPSGNKN
jgi:oligopeptide transport system ATP-binding protein